MALQQHTIDIGIDLGTTNSSIAVVVDGRPVIVPNQRNRPTTPSVVRIRPNGAIDVGELAYQQLESRPGDVYAEFKRAMGETDAVYRFDSTGRTMTPPELSAEVLRVLRADVEQRHGVLPTAAVITVPAAFGLAQCAATQSAAELAGLEQAPLLQEPVAASLAYGYAQDVTSGTWLVYDLGGGTFDLALVGVVDGRIAVLDHEGDNFLGGKDFDWIVVEELLIPRLRESYAVSSFVRGAPERRAAMAVLKARAEELKIALSGSFEATVTVESGRDTLTDDTGQEIDTDITVSRAEYEAMIQAPVSRTIEHCRRLLTRNRQAAPSSVLLVGGPTLTPYVRRRVAEDLGIQVAGAVDPMTVVAQGAALYAAAQPMAMGVATTRATGRPEPGATVVLKHTTVTDDTETSVGVQVSDASASAIEVSRGDGSWRSGLLGLNKGVVALRVPLFNRGANEFELVVTGDQGQRLTVDQREFSIFRGVTAAAPPLSRSIGVVVRDPSSGRKIVEKLLEKGTPLPSKATFEFRTTLALDPGGDVEIVGVYFVEGESPRPERDRIVGRVEITDGDVSRYVPAGAPIEVQVNVSASRLLSAQVFLPSVDQTFSVDFQMESEQVSQRELAKSLLDEQKRIDASAEHLDTRELVDFGRRVEDVRASMHSVSGDDPGSGQLALSRLKELQTALDKVDSEVELPLAVRSGREAASAAGRATSTFGSESQQRRMEALTRELEAAIVNSDLANIERATSKMHRLHFEVLGAQPWFWREWFEYLSASEQVWLDPAEADNLVRAGTRAISSGDVDTLRRVTVGLSALARGDEGSFINVGIGRGR